MAFVAEDGTGLELANAFIDLAFFDAYHTDLGHDFAVAATTLSKETAIVRASQFVEQRFRHRFKGRREKANQGLSWPRFGAYDRDGFILSEVPQQLKKAVAEYALRAISYGELAPDVPPTVPRQDNSVGTVEETSTTTSGAVTEETTEVAGAVKTTIRYSSPSSTSTSTNSRIPQSTLVDTITIPQYPTADLWISELIRSSNNATIRIA